jgi:hypothetical protein
VSLSGLKGKVVVLNFWKRLPILRHGEGSPENMIQP